MGSLTEDVLAALEEQAVRANRHGVLAPCRPSDVFALIAEVRKARAHVSDDALSSLEAKAKAATDEVERFAYVLRFAIDHPAETEAERQARRVVLQSLAAAANPEAALGLIAEVRRLKARVEALDDERDVLRSDLETCRESNEKNMGAGLRAKAALSEVDAALGLTGEVTPAARTAAVRARLADVAKAQAASDARWTEAVVEVERLKSALQASEEARTQTETAVREAQEAGRAEWQQAMGVAAQACRAAPYDHDPTVARRYSLEAIVALAKSPTTPAGRLTLVAHHLRAAKALCEATRTDPQADNADVTAAFHVKDRVESSLGVLMFRDVRKG